MPKYKLKDGVGTHYMRRSGLLVKVKQGEVVACTQQELGGAKDKFERIGPEPESPPLPKPITGLRLVERAGGWFDVINEATGEKINDTAVREDAAYALAGLTK